MKVFVGESSYIIRKGFIRLLNEFNELDTIKEFSSSDDLERLLLESTPDIIVVNTSFNQDEINNLLLDSEKQPIILHLFNSPLPINSVKTHLSIFEGKASLMEKIQQALTISKDNHHLDSGEDLSPREKLVLKHVALGQTNKEIAESLFISTHTVISHRKNITRKLGIKTVSGLTVYAILNKIIGMGDVN
jgi:DNA-binding NarL/FixJ family response regulator